MKKIWNLTMGVIIFLGVACFAGKPANATTTSTENLAVATHQSAAENTETTSTTTKTEETTTTTTGESSETTTSSTSGLIDGDSIEDNIVEETPFDYTAEAIGIEPGDSAEKIRKALLVGNYYISEEELDTFTDSQLENTLTVFFKYNQDFYGMDLGAYTRLLIAIYQDNTLSWDTMTPYLDYNPNTPKHATDLLGNLQQLQGYLKAFYPPESSFLGMKTLSDQELTDILTYLAAYEEEVAFDKDILWVGRIGYIDYYTKNGLPTTDSSKQNTHTSTTSSTKVAATDEDGKKLPQTNDQSSLILLVIGGVILLFVIVVFVKRRAVKK
ncbi:LPXTG cell wall anchor domain-containing protein [Enterococcus sp. LJL120]